MELEYIKNGEKETLFKKCGLTMTYGNDVFHLCFFNNEGCYNLHLEKEIIDYIYESYLELKEKENNNF